MNPCAGFGRRRRGQCKPVQAESVSLMDSFSVLMFDFVRSRLVLVIENVVYPPLFAVVERDAFIHFLCGALVNAIRSSVGAAFAKWEHEQAEDHSRYENNLMKFHDFAPSSPVRLRPLS